MPSKFYAVAIGREPGIYYDWPTAQKNIKGYPGAVFKSFATEIEAEEFLEANQDLSDLEFRVEAYTDGSFVKPKGGFGVVMITPNNIYVASGPVPDTYDKMSNNVAELYAIYIAVTMYKGDLRIYSDSQYSIKVLSKNYHYKTNIALINEIKKNLQNRLVDFQYIEAHVGHKYNELADRLAAEGRRSGIIKINY